MTSRQKAKGYNYEIRTRDFLNSIEGISAKRNYMSGALKNEVPELDGDIRATIKEKDYKVEVKAKTNFPKWLEHAETQGDFTVLWKCGKPKSQGYVLLPLKIFKELME